MPTPTETWQDRRGMFQRGKEIHQPGRKLSNQFGDPLAARRTSTGSTGGGGLEKTESITEPGSQGQRRRVRFHSFPDTRALWWMVRWALFERNASCSGVSAQSNPVFESCPYSVACSGTIRSLLTTHKSTNTPPHLVLRRLPRPIQQPQHPQARQRRLRRTSRQLHRNGRELPRHGQRLVQPHFQRTHG
jgi:hypothetical protein